MDTMDRVSQRWLRVMTLVVFGSLACFSVFHSSLLSTLTGGARVAKEPSTTNTTAVDTQQQQQQQQHDHPSHEKDGSQSNRTEQPEEEKEAKADLEVTSYFDELIATGAVQIPPPGYPWDSVGRFRVNSNQVPDILSSMEYTMRSLVNSSSLIRREGHNFPYFIRNGKLLTPVPASVRSTFRRQVAFEQVVQSALNVAKALKRRVCAEMEDLDGAQCHTATREKIHPRFHEMINLNNISIPLLFNHGDIPTPTCERNDVNEPELIPTFTMCAPSNAGGGGPIECEYMPFPTPTYALWNPLHSMSMYSPEDWQTGGNSTESFQAGALINRANLRDTLNKVADGKPALWDLGWEGMATVYPWKEKISKALWRGTNTGRVRAPIVKLGAVHPDVLDVGWIMARGPMNKEPIAFQDFMKYKAIIDMDGKAWSSRFGNVLCMNSVVIKVEPQWVDYWHKELQPWVHYVPARYDGKDLVNRTRYVMDPANDEEMQGIVRAANEWCSKKATLSQLSVDMLWILFSYLDKLNDAAMSRTPNATLSSWLSQWDSVRLTKRSFDALAGDVFGDLT